MRPRSSGDDFEDDDDDDDEFEDVSPLITLEPEPGPAPPQPTRPPLSSIVVRPPPPSAGRPVRSPTPPDGGPRRGSPPLRRRRYGTHPGPSPPPRLRRFEASTFDDGPQYTRGYQGGGKGGRFRGGSPPYGRGRRSSNRGHPGKDFIKIDGEYVHRNDPNLSPREGDWICQNPNCGNLNFAWRTHCNNCNKYRYPPEVYEPSRSPRRGYLSPPPRGPARIGGPPVERAPPREMTRYRSPPRGWGMGEPRGYASQSPPADRAKRFAEPSLKERMAFRADRDPRDRAKFDWFGTEDYSQRERPPGGMYLNRSPCRSGSPRGNWSSDMRDRSHSPRNGQMKSSFSGRGPYISQGRPSNLEPGCDRGRGYRPGGGPYLGEDRGDRRAAPRARNDYGY